MVPPLLIVFGRLSVSTSFVLAALRALHVDTLRRGRSVAGDGGTASGEVGGESVGVGQGQGAEGGSPAVHGGAFDEAAWGGALDGR